MLLAMLLLEHLWPRKRRTQLRRYRWPTNIAISAIDSIAVRVILPVLAVGVAEFSASKQWGLFNNIDWPGWLEFLAAVIILDMLIYWQHVASHYFPVLWNIHKVHHVDRDFDTTTGIRFHPVEILLSMLYKFLCVLLLGPAAIAVFVFEVLLNATALFNHANLHIPYKLDGYLRLLLVTPDMHRVHHSVHPKETDSNYGFNLSIWDRLFGSYIPQPADGHTDMIIGVANYQHHKPSSLLWSLLLPIESIISRFRGKQ